jgi:peptide chain release factor 1
MIDKVIQLLERYKELETLMADPETSQDAHKMESLSREYNTLSKQVPLFEEYLEAHRSLEEAHKVLATESDPEYVALAQEEKKSVQDKIPALEEKIKMCLVPEDPDDTKNAIVEVRAGTGGVEAAIFAADLFKMLSSFIEHKGWKSEILSSNYGELGSIKMITFMVKGDHAYGTLKFESGIHRVQRVPQTESQGRIHTSAASVAVFPEADAFDIQIDQNDLRIDVYRSSGPGGQSVNTTDSAVRITHIPTSIVVSCQDEKSQHKNKAKAMKILTSRVFDLKRREKQQQETALRRSLVGSGDRSEKIRTYNYPQGRVTDHRIPITLYKLDEIMRGDLSELLDALVQADVNERLRQQQLHTT